MQATRLANGVRVLSEPLPDLTSTTVGIWVENGSRYERAEQAGISHFLEHLFFKGTARRTAAQIAQEIDAVGGVLNAFTGKEYTCYYAKVLREHLPLALDLLADIFTQSTFAAEEIERERSVIVQEISQVEDTPDDYVHELFNLTFWPGHPLSRPIAGTAETVSRLGRDDFLRFLEARYRPDRVLIAAAGALTHDALLAVADRQFGALAGSAAGVDGGPPEPRAGFSTKSRCGARIASSRRRSHCIASVAYVAGTGIPAAANRRLALGLWSTTPKSARGLYGTRKARLRRFMPSASRWSRRSRAQKPLNASPAVAPLRPRRRRAGGGRDRRSARTRAA